MIPACNELSLRPVQLSLGLGKLDPARFELLLCGIQFPARFFELRNGFFQHPLRVVQLFAGFAQPLFGLFILPFAFLELFVSVVQLFTRFVQLPLRVVERFSAVVDLSLRTRSEFRFTNRGAFTCETLDPFIQHAERASVCVCKMRGEPFYFDFRAHITVIERFGIERFTRDHNIQRVGHASADMVRMDDQTGEGIAIVLQVVRDRTLRAADQNAVADMPAHRLGDALLNGAFVRLLRQSAFQQDREIDTLGLRDHGHILAAIRGRRLGARRKNAFDVRHAVYDANEVQIVL